MPEQARCFSWTHAGRLACGAGELAYAEAGSGSPLVLLPKLGGCIAEWRHIAGGLAVRRRVVAIDPPGHGASRMFAPPPYIQTVTESAAAILAVLDTLGIERFAVAGASIGGCIAIVLAALWPERVERVALLSTSMATRMDREALRRGDAAAREAFAPDGTPLPRQAADLARFGPMSPEVIAEQNESRAASGLWLRPCERGAGRLGIAEHLPRIQAPCLVLNAAQGHYTQYAETAARLIRDVRVLTMADTGPFMHQEQPAATLRVLGEFFDA